MEKTMKEAVKTIKTKEQAVHIIYASNDGYAGHLAASLCSLLDNNRHIKNLDIYVLSAQMCEAFQNRLKTLAAGFGRQLYAVELGDLKERFPYKIDTRGFDISAMGRLFAPEVLPETVTKALYLDCDTIVCSSIEKMYETPLGDCLAGMIMEPTVYKEMKESIDMDKDDAYFNSGVILMDVAGWRRENVLKKLLDFYGDHAGSLFACDQDTINGALNGRILPLSPRYNFFTNYRYFRYNTLVQLCDAYRAVGKKEFAAAKRRPTIIHFLGDERPWIGGSHNYYGKWYWKYLAMTPWKDMPMQKGKFWYMQLWWCFNQMTRVCPALRLAISKRLGMKVIDNRKKHQKK